MNQLVGPERNHEHHRAALSSRRSNLESERSCWLRSPPINAERLNSETGSPFVGLQGAQRVHSASSIRQVSSGSLDGSATLGHPDGTFIEPSEPVFSDIIVGFRAGF